jgi:hypothetical protein
MRQECEEFIQKVNFHRMEKSCIVEKAEYTYEDGIKGIDCFLQYLGYPNKPEVPQQNTTTFSSSPSNTTKSPIPQTE